MQDALVAFGLVALAELGDKSMLLAVAFAARYRATAVLAGIAVAAAVMLGVAAGLGAAAGAALPTRWITLSGGLLFVAFGVLTFRDTLRGGADSDDEGADEVRGRSVLLGVALAFLAAEFGDKTMLATATLAASRAPLATWLGATVGMWSASATAVALTRLVGRRVPQRTVRLVAAALFLVVGAVLVVEGVLA